MVHSRPEIKRIVCPDRPCRKQIGDFSKQDKVCFAFKLIFNRKDEGNSAPTYRGRSALAVIMMENLEDLPDNIGIGSLDDLDYLIMLAELRLIDV